MHVRTCNPARIYIFGMAGLIKLKLGIRLGDDKIGGVQQFLGVVAEHVRTCTPRFYILGTAEPIVLKFATWVGAN